MKISSICDAVSQTAQAGTNSTRFGRREPVYMQTAFRVLIDFDRPMPQLLGITAPIDFSLQADLPIRIESARFDGGHANGVVDNGDIENFRESDTHTASLKRTHTSN